MKANFKCLVTKIICVFTFLLLNISCKKLIQIDPPINESAGDAIFKTESSANSALNGMYVAFLQLFDSTKLFYPSFSSDEMSNSSILFFKFYTNSINSIDDPNLDLWQRSYQVLYQSNSIIEGANSSKTLSQVFKNQLIGEAKFVRAFTYFELVNFYGDVPLITTTDVQINAFAPRVSVGNVYQQIIADLKDTQSLLTDTYPSADRARINKSSATALLARTYLYQKKYTDAEIQATSLINNTGLYQIEQLSVCFVKSSKETIFQIANSDDYTIGNILIPGSNSTVVDFPYTSDFVNSIESNDQRKKNWMNQITINNKTYLYPYKYKKTSSGLNSGLPAEYLVVLRLGEQYLIRAEARAEQNNLDGARDDLNVIRGRAGLGNNIQTNKTEILSAIEKERRIELSIEFGHRWFDLKRTNRINEVLSLTKPNWKLSASLYPIPLEELNKNPNLTQNPGY